MSGARVWVVPWDGRSHRLGPWALPYFREVRLLVCESAPPPAEALGTPLDAPWVEAPGEAAGLVAMLAARDRVLWLAAAPESTVERLRQAGVPDVVVLDSPGRAGGPLRRSRTRAGSSSRGPGRRHGR